MKTCTNCELYRCMYHKNIMYEDEPFCIQENTCSYIICPAGGDRGEVTSSVQQVETEVKLHHLSSRRRQR